MTNSSLPALALARSSSQRSFSVKRLKILMAPISPRSPIAASASSVLPTLSSTFCHVLLVHVLIGYIAMLLEIEPAKLRPLEIDSSAIAF